MIIQKVILIFTLIILIGFLSQKKRILENFKVIDVNNTEYTKIIVNTNDDDNDDNDEDSSESDDMNNDNDVEDENNYPKINSKSCKSTKATKAVADSKSSKKSTKKDTIIAKKDTCNINLDDYVLKSSVPPPPKMPDLTDYIHKSLVPKLDDYVLKTSIDPTSEDNNVCLSQDYILKSAFPAYKKLIQDNFKNIDGEMYIPPTKNDIVSEDTVNTIKNNVNSIIDTIKDNLEKKIPEEIVTTPIIKKSDNTTAKIKKKSALKIILDRISNFFHRIYRFFINIYNTIYNFFEKLFGLKKIKESFDSIGYYDIYNSQKESIIQEDIHRQINQIKTEDVENNKSLLDIIDIQNNNTTFYIEDDIPNETCNNNNPIDMNGDLPTQTGLRDPTFIEMNYKAGLLPNTINNDIIIEEFDNSNNNFTYITNNDTDDLISISNSIKNKLPKIK